MSHNSYIMRWNRNLLAGLLLLLNTCLLSAQDVPPGLQAALDKALDSMGLVLNIKSISVALALPSNVVWANATGVSAANEAVTPSHTYLIGSTTKMLTAACILQLDDEGVLSIDDPLHQWLDTIPNIKPDIRIRQLMQHTSGIFDVLYNPSN